MPNYKAAFEAASLDLSAIMSLLGFTSYPGIDPMLRAVTNLVLAKAEAQALREEVAALRKDKARLDAIEGNCWDVRYDSSPNGDAGDSSISIEVIGYYQGKPHVRVLGENYTENLRAAIDQAMTAEAYPPERPEYDDHGTPLRSMLGEGKEHE